MIAQFQIINKVLQNKDYSFITLNNLTAEHFYGYKAEYEFIKTHYETLEYMKELTFTVNPNIIKVSDIKDVILIGNITVIPGVKYVLERIEKVQNINFIVPENSEFAVVLGAIKHCENEE